MQIRIPQKLYTLISLVYVYEAGALSFFFIPLFLAMQDLAASPRK